MDANMDAGPETSHVPRPLGRPSGPHVGVGVIVVRDGRVLLGRRHGDTHGADTWQFPGGHLEAGESPEACAEREVREETGLVVRAVARGPYTSDVFADAGRHYVTLFVLAEPLESGAEADVCEPHKCAEWRWCAWDAMPAPRFLPIEHLLATGWRPGGVASGAARDRGAAA